MKKEDIILRQIEFYQVSPAVWNFRCVDDIVHGINLK